MSASASIRLERLLCEIRACRVCSEQPSGPPLPHAPRPVLRVGIEARLGLFSQAPGARVHTSGLPFTDASGDRLRDWMGVGTEAFYDTRRLAILPMGFCFPGYDDKGADLPPRQECAPLWRARVLAELPRLELVLLVGQYAQRWHLGPDAKGGTTRTVARWREIMQRPGPPRYLPLPHPSWRNTGWLKANPWFGDEVLPVLKREVRRLMQP